MRYSSAGIKSGILHRRKILTIGVDPMASSLSRMVIAKEQIANGMFNHTTAVKHRAKKMRGVALGFLRPTLSVRDVMAGKAKARLTDGGASACHQRSGVGVATSADD